MDFRNVASRTMRTLMRGHIHAPATFRLQCLCPLSTFVRDAPPHTSPTSPPPPQEAPQRKQNSQVAPMRQNDQEEQEEKKQLRNPRNEEIKFSYVRLVNPETGTLESFAPLRAILQRVNRKSEYLELVKKEPEPIVKILQAKALYNKSKAKKIAQASKKAPEEKEVQLTWGVGMGDLQYKLKKVREELQEGNRVNLVFAPKKGQKLPSPTDQQKMVEETLRLLEDVAKERRDRAVQKHAIGVFLESTRQKRVVELRWAQGDGDLWEGLKTLENALRQGERVEAIFILPPPPKKKAEDADAMTVDPDVAQERLERTLLKLVDIGREWKPRDTRKGVVVVHMEPFKPKPS